MYTMEKGILGVQSEKIIIRVAPSSETRLTRGMSDAKK